MSDENSQKRMFMDDTHLHLIDNNTGKELRKDINSSEYIKKSADFGELFLNNKDQNNKKILKKLLMISINKMIRKSCNLIGTYTNICNEDASEDINPCEIFVCKQIIKIIHSICMKCIIDKNITIQYFNEINDKINNLINEVNFYFKILTENKCPDKIILLNDLKIKYYFIISDTMRLLYLIEEMCGNVDNTTFTSNYYTDDLSSYLNNKFHNIKLNSVSSLNNSEIMINATNGMYSICIRPKKSNKIQSIFNIYRISQQIDEKSSSQQDEKSCMNIPCENDFNIIKIISQGAYSVVYLVKHILTNTRYAMKKIHKNHALLKNQVRQIFAERDILSFTDNPFIISMFCTFETTNAFCMVMEYAQGGDCASLLKSIGILSLELAKMFIAETLAAIQYIHHYGIVHCDIKPDNLLITSLGHIKLTDFGLSRIGLIQLTTLTSHQQYLSAFHHKNSIMGTPAYIAPEIILNQSFTFTADYWSLGIVLYQFLIGCTPFYAPNIEDLFQSIVTDSIEWPMDDEAICPIAQDIISQLLLKNPLLRLGIDGADSVKSHPFFSDIEWDKLLQFKTQYSPDIHSQDDTSHFDQRFDRYVHHQLYSDDSTSTNSSSPSSSFTSYTKKFKQHMNSTDSPVLSPPIEESQQVADLKSLSKFITIPRDQLLHKLNFGFITTRVTFGQNFSFIIHLINFVKNQDIASSQNIQLHDVILSINDSITVGKPHSKLIKIMFASKVLKLQLCSLQNMSITKHSSSNHAVYKMDMKSMAFKNLVDLGVKFQIQRNDQYQNIHIDQHGNIRELIETKGPPHPNLNKKNNSIKSFFKNVVRRHHENFSSKKQTLSQNILMSVDSGEDSSPTNLKKIDDLGQFKSLEPNDHKLMSESNISESPFHIKKVVIDFMKEKNHHK